MVVRKGLITIPLSDIRSMEMSGSRFSSRPPRDGKSFRWLTINTGDGSTFIFEIYDLPPGMTVLLPGHENGLWLMEILHAKSAFLKR